jgi:trans-aconitate 2-methyltransferase
MRLGGIDPNEVWDLGCGSGEITRLLAERWPDARVHGLDSSPEMLASAHTPASRVSWVRGDIADWDPERPADLVFANASLHWVADHDRLFPRLAGALTPGGVLAVQMPRNADEPSHRILAEVARRKRWSGRVGYRADWRPVGPPDDYLDHLAPHCETMEVWETVYHHVLTGEDAVARWVEGAACRPFLDDLGDDAGEFFDEYATALRPHYPRRDDGTTRFPFRRLFILAVR